MGRLDRNLDVMLKFTERPKHQTMCIFKAGLSRLSDGCAKYKKVTYVSDPNQNVEATCNSKIKVTELKDLFIKRCKKLDKDELCM